MEKDKANEPTEKVSAEQRAAKIADLAEHVLFSDIPDGSFTPQAVEGRRLLLQTITSEINNAIEQAEREAYKAGFAAGAEAGNSLIRKLRQQGQEKNLRRHDERGRDVGMRQDEVPGAV